MTSRILFVVFSDRPLFTHVLYVVTSNATVFIGLDACFKFKLKERGFRDPDLGSGLAYVVPDSAYREHLSRHAASKSRSDVSHLYRTGMERDTDARHRVSLAGPPSMP